MRPVAILLLALAPSLAAQARRPTPTPRELVARAAEAMGGEAALRGLRSVSTRFASTTFGIGQEETWASPPRPTVIHGSSATDYAGARRAVSQESRPVATPSGANVVRQVLLSDHGATETNGTMVPMGAAAVRAGHRAMREAPERLILFMLDNVDALRPVPARRWREEELDGLRVVMGTDSLAVHFDRITGRPVLVVTVTDDAVRGDLTTEVAYHRWTPTNGVMLPRQVDVTANGRMLSTLQVGSAEVNGSLDEAWFAIRPTLADSARALAAAGPAAAPIRVVLTELAPGVWRAEGQTHHTLVVEQGNGLVLVEAPQSSARMRAVLDTLARRFPGKLVTQVVSTHHHYDHTGGLREAMSRGYPVTTHQRNVEFANRVAAATKTIAPDGLSRGGRRPPVRGVTDTLAIGSGTSAVVLYPIASVHAEGMLAAFVPSAGVLFTSDVLNPPPNPATQPLNPVGAAELVTFARARALTVRTVAGGHGVALRWEDVERAVPR